MPSTGKGYVYVPDEYDGVFACACPGAIIRLGERRPPWIVVDHSIESVIVARWPGKLWQVRIVDSDGVEQVSTCARYTRAIAVQVCDEIPVSRLFGEHGDVVCSVITQANHLDPILIPALANARHPDAGQAYSRAWNNWLIKLGSASESPEGDVAGTRGISGPEKGSPINHGFEVLHRAIWNRADSLVGSSAFRIDEEGERYFEPTWSSASCALLEAAMAFGAPTLSTAEDRLIQLAAWHTVFGFDLTEEECSGQ
jgi:hypothetical protein